MAQTGNQPAFPLPNELRNRVRIAENRGHSSRLIIRRFLRAIAPAAENRRDVVSRAMARWSFGSGWVSVCRSDANLASQSMRIDTPGSLVTACALGRN